MASINQSSESAPAPSTSLPLPVLWAFKALEEKLESGGDITDVFIDPRKERVRAQHQILTYAALQPDPVWGPTESLVTEKELRKAKPKCIQDVYDLGIGKAALAIKKDQRIQDFVKVLGRVEKDKSKPLSKKDISVLRALVSSDQWNAAQIPRNQKFSKKLTRRLEMLGITKPEEED